MPMNGRCALKIGSCEYPDSLLYDTDAGTWARREGELVRIGIAPHLSWITGGFTSVSIKPIGSEVKEGKNLGSVEGPRHFDVVKAPFDCIIKDANSALHSSPRLVNKDPFGQGWLVVVEQITLASRLLPLAEAAESLHALVERLNVHCFSEFPDSEMFEIGVECSAVLVRLNEEIAKRERGWVTHIVSDDPTSDIEMARWEDQTGNKVVEVVREGNLQHFIVRKS